MKYTELTKSQKEQIRKIQKKAVLHMIINSLKFGTLVFLSTLIIIFINVFYVKNQGFQFIATFITSFVLFRSFASSHQKEYDRINKELCKILEK